ncbi:UNVERIFIED_CONTAM: hypothetical protein GTU68_054052, partial [Idotea baltica]|nr:hypothetical protein [Idotea baltica]
IRPAKLWNDTTTAPDAGWLIGQLDGGAAEWSDRCGSVPLAAFTIAKLSWLHRSEPENWSRVAGVCLPHDWLTLQLSGSLVTDRGDASGTGYWSPRDGSYDLDLLRVVDTELNWAEMLPEVHHHLDVVGEWNGASVAAGTGDNMAGALGLGLGTGDVAVSIGTSGTVYSVSDEPTQDPTGAVAGFADATGRYLPLVCTLNAAKVTDTVRSLMGCSIDEFEQLAMQGGAPSGALPVLVPYFDGERTPNLPDATGKITGLRTGTTREQLALSAVTGVVCGLLDGLDALGAAGARTDGAMWVTGGGARSAVYRQVLADCSGRVVHTSPIDEAVAAGACVQAVAVLERADPLEVRASWNVGEVPLTEPRETDIDGVRERYSEAAEATSN